MHQVCEKERCTGCGVCSLVCPKDAIQMKKNTKGFLVPVIDQEKCIDCKKCSRTCHVNQFALPDEGKTEVWAGKNHNQKIRKESTSGGVFTCLAEDILEKNGVVCGVAMRGKHAEHIFVTERKALKKLRGAKYVQSKAFPAFEPLKKKVLTGIPVLFSGTPCQVAALKMYLGKEYENLICVEVVCHGAPSPEVFEKYVTEMEKQQNSEIRSVAFRKKKKSWSCSGMELIFENGHVYEKDKNHDPFLVGFAKDLFLRESCHTCKYACEKRAADITLGDFWGFQVVDSAMTADRWGISLVLTNTPKGQKALQEISKSLTLQKRTYAEAAFSNSPLRKPTAKPEKAGEFWKKYESGEAVSSILKEMCPPIHVPLKYKIWELRGRYSYLIKNILKMKRV